jgi:hypothetical protein
MLGGEFVRRIETTASVRFVSSLLAGMVLWIITGCGSMGPTTVNRDRSDYITAISESWKQQTLLNIVKLRYADTPVFLEIGQVISGYELEGTLSAGGTLGDKDWRTAGGALGTFLSLGAGGRYLDRPTVTYTPLVGPDFIKTMMTPFPPGAVMFLIEAGWPVDMILRIGTHSVNGLRNQKGGPYGHPADPEFIEILRLLRKIQLTGSIGMTLEREKTGEESSLILFHTRHITPEIAEDVVAVKRLLGINPEARSFKITYGSDAQVDNEIALHTRSGFQVLIELAVRASVPPEHVAEHRTVEEGPLGGDKEFILPPLVSIHSGQERPSDSFVQVRYRNHWFWVDDRDFSSKRVLSFLMMLLTLSDTGQKIQAPILTIRAN